MTERKSPSPAIPAHAHCVGCGHSVAVGQSFCSTECEQKLAGQRRRQRRTSFMFLGIIVVIFLIWLIAAGRGGG